MDQKSQRSIDETSLPSSMDSADTTDTLLEKPSGPYNTRKLPFWREHLILVLSTGLLFQALADITHPSTAPANEALRWEVVEWEHDDGAQGDYVGEPRPVLEKTWKDIFNIMNVRISEDDLKAVDRLENAVRLPDEPSYVGTLNVFHELHCIWWLYKYVHMDHYFADATPHQRGVMKLHSHHCLNYLRKSAMCHGDVGIITYNWMPNSRKPNATATTHQCADWERITEWSSARAVNMTRPGYLVHPSLGPVFREGEKEELAVGIPPHDVEGDVDVDEIG
ncbi:hypothetical protein FQN50_008025 [Emmonsiellopsis sp. PD_5]|nr:hypothetical protein FQN50_008025 [Emmonsiellopsis sp. PD_5]